MRKSKRQEAIFKKKDDSNSSFEKQQRNTNSKKELIKKAGKRHGSTTTDKTSIKLLSVVIVPLIAVAAVVYSTRTNLEQEDKKVFVKITPDKKVTKYDLHGGWDQAALEDENLFNTSFCNIDRRYAEDLSEEQFERNYRFKKPLLVRFRNGAAGWTKPEKWSKQSLIEEYGRWEVLSGKCDDIVKRGGSGDTKTSFLDYLKLMHDSRHKLEPMYVFDRSFYHDSDLPSTIKPPRYFRVQDKIHDSIFFLGTSRSGVSFHKHADTWNGVVYGRKRWYLYSPQRTPPGGVWPSFSQQDWVKIVYPRLRHDELPTNECIQEAGEILYLPESYYHATVNIGDTIAVAIQKKEATSRIEQIIYEAGKLEAKIRESDQVGDSKEVRKQVNLFEELSTILPNSTEALHKLADAYTKMGNEVKAVEILEKVIRMDPWFVNARIDLARLYLLIERDNDARRQFEEALKIHPEHVEGNHDYGSFLMDQGDYQKAAKLFRKAIKIKPNVSAGYFHLARALENLGDTEEARKAREKGEKLDEEQED